jgi:hypothetical protein
MSLRGALQTAERAHKREIRAANARHRQLQKQAKEQAKASLQEQARMEVEAHEASIDTLLSIHKEAGLAWNWRAIAAQLPALEGVFEFHEGAASRATHWQSFWSRTQNSSENDGPAVAARQRDFQNEAAARAKRENAKNEAAQLRALARRILAGDTSAFTEALVELNPLSELSELGSSVHFVFHDARTVECSILVQGREAIPKEQKSITASGKLSVKALPKGRFHELYQDYVCACVLRLAREIFALLPVDSVLVTATVEQESANESIAEAAALSVAFRREPFLNLNFESIDPSDAIELFTHRGSFKASRKTGAFEIIQPLQVADVVARSAYSGLLDLRSAAQTLRDQIKLEVERNFE